VLDKKKEAAGNAERGFAGGLFVAYLVMGNRLEGFN